MTLYRTDLEEYLKDMGYAVTIVDGKNDQNTQTEQINTCSVWVFWSFLPSTMVTA